MIDSTSDTAFTHHTLDALTRRTKAAIHNIANQNVDGFKRYTVRFEDKLREDGLALDTEQDLWAQVGQIGAIELEDGSRLRIAIEDTSTRLNLNAVIGGQGEDGRPNDNAEALLREVLDKIIEEMDIPPGEKALYDREDLVGNLIDYVDVNEDKHFGGYEASVYDLRDDLRCARYLGTTSLAGRCFGCRVDWCAATGDLHRDRATAARVQRRVLGHQIV